MIRFYSLTNENRIGVTSVKRSGSEGMQQMNFPENFDFSRQMDWKVLNGELMYDPLPDETPNTDEVMLLKAQIEAMSDRSDFLEDCIAEIAEQIYR